MLADVFKPPYYTLEEAQTELKINPAQMRNELENGELTPVVYTKPRAFLLFVNGNVKLTH